jgi:F0F1-type ATP synthase membrane subunit a
MEVLFVVINISKKNGVSNPSKVQAWMEMVVTSRI